MADGDFRLDKVRSRSGRYAHIDVIHAILDYTTLTHIDRTLLNRLCHQICVSRQDWAELDRIWQRVRRAGR